MPTPYTASLPDADATDRAGRALAQGLEGGMVVTLSGELGAGKTTFARGVLRGLGWQGPVKSPSYTLLEHYPLSSLYLYHFDFYRFADPQEWETVGAAECFTPSSVGLVEWPERAGDRLGNPDLLLQIEYAPPGRAIEVTASSEAGRQVLAALRLDPV